MTDVLIYPVYDRDMKQLFEFNSSKSFFVANIVRKFFLSEKQFQVAFQELIDKHLTTRRCLEDFVRFLKCLL